MLEDSLILLFKYMNNQDDLVSMATFPFAILYLNKLKSTIELNSKELEHLNMFLQVIRNRIKYSQTYDIDKKPEEDEDLKEYRKVIYIFYQF
jgi:hypothetical protein